MMGVGSAQGSGRTRAREQGVVPRSIVLDVKPHLRVAALRALQDSSPHDALVEIIGLLRGGFRERSEAAFVALTKRRALAVCRGAC